MLHRYRNKFTFYQEPIPAAAFDQFEWVIDYLGTYPASFVSFRSEIGWRMALLSPFEVRQWYLWMHPVGKGERWQVLGLCCWMSFQWLRQLLIWFSKTRVCLLFVLRLKQLWKGCLLLFSWEWMLLQCYSLLIVSGSSIWLVIPLIRISL